VSSKNLYSTNRKEYLEANRELAENLQLPDEDAAQITIPKADPAAQATDRKKKVLHVLGIIMRAFINDGGNTDWTGAGFGILALAALIIGGTILTKKN